MEDHKEQVRPEIQEARAASASPARKPQENIPGNDEKFGTLENSVEYLSQSNQKLAARIQKIEKWKEQADEGQDRLLPSKATAEPINQTPTQIEKLEEQISSLKDQLNKSEQVQSQWSSVQNQTRDNTSALQNLKAAFESAKPGARINTLETEVQKLWLDCLKSQSDAGAQATWQSAIQQLEAKYRAVNQQVDTLLPLVTPLKEQMDILLPLEPKMKTALEKLQNSLQLDRQATQTLRTRMDNCEGSQETMKTAIRSLEHRYANINSENLVKSMAHAMHEMYPSTQNQIDQLNALQSQIDLNKAEVTKEIDLLRNSRANEHTASTASTPPESKEMSERFTLLQERQRSQADDIVQHLVDIKYLQSQLEGYQAALAELGEKQADDSCAQFKEMRALGLESTIMPRCSKTRRKRTKIRKTLSSVSGPSLNQSRSWSLRIESKDYATKVRRRSFKISLVASRYSIQMQS